ncbi:MAG TPA: hypothetical protein DCL81_15165 [Algoriphagus sp.]|uniref:hypothetical protein n=1 Tax=Algoriphagus sp. TaxID=1872435 RepID=UPI000C5F3050|nr:hypothetical protein [Algoriphagus sp.]MAL13371.1 hypothetical protein [Algoriphagus sp.]MAN85561.1 hypothetical protein [Algoriphagus sp.]HAH37793.1 hypothetical protein [Algoriphagus sp.]HAS58504.1 hypothetical protein [Algoriphagus sp.]HCX77516.1 hypothetical protein [Algoriphagus sp.]|tara:strand:+ start:5334 stop:5543 length:210 start_codon:yes stop_codon:yes gene_type:complete
MKRPKVVRLRYTRSAWKKMEEKALKALIDLQPGVKTPQSVLFGLSKIPENLFWVKVGETVRVHEKKTRP